ncbi:PREDICTED: uncharacterized protein LOC104821916 [Tarenaya hassleriana]|uniref:uncharacterized protein LOC104821916 n=1 Tax=Tarenaya hassleriana TaxID=28532 RepID=UPI00053C53B1|nr:PREDICTED: uncharacterized protein LOC104821916 [Tarenaya hassleriana]
MAIDVVCSSSESPRSGISPRISFSNDLVQTDGCNGGELRLDSTLLDSGSDFDFCFGSGCSVQELSSADELFSNGKILPVQIKKYESFSQKPVRVQRSSSLSSSSSSFCNQKATEKKRLKELLLNPDSDLEDKPSSSSSLFLQLKRSISLNYDTSRGKGLIRSLQFLTRSNSTGSAPNPKPNLHPKETHHHQKIKNQSLPRRPSPLRRSSSLSNSAPHLSYHSVSTPKPFHRHSFGGYNNGSGGVRVSPVLNFPSPTFMSSSTVGFFGLGSLCTGKMNRRTR